MSDSPFDPFAALRKLGVTQPEPVELPAPEPSKAEDEAEYILGLGSSGGGVGVRTPVLPSIDTQNPKDLLGSKKPALVSVIPSAGLLHLGSAMAEGARKYGAFNWRDKDVKATIYGDAIMRHLLQWLDGEDIDPESGCHHLGHIMASAAIVLDAQSLGKLADDRPLPGASGRMIRGYTPQLKFDF